MTTNPKFQSHFETSAASLKESIVNHLRFGLARDVETATRRDWWLATSRAAQTRIIERMLATQEVHHRSDARRVYYLSLEFLMGRLFSNSLYSAGIFNEVEEALKELGLDLEQLRGEEYDMGLGNGGLGRLAACFLDSLATLDYPAIGYGIHYEFGLFRQEFTTATRPSMPDDWMRSARLGNRPSRVHPDGRNLRRGRERLRRQGNYVPRWVNTRKIVGVPYDIPIPGYGTNTVNFLRLWESRPLGEDQPGGLQPRRLQRGARRRTCRAKPSRRFSTRTTRRRRQGTAPGPAILLRLLLPARHHPPLPAESPASGPSSRTRSPSSSTTPTPLVAVVGAPPHPPRRGAARLGRGLGHRHPAPSATPTTPCCPRRWSGGACRFSRKSCRAISSSFSRSTSATCSRRLRRCLWPGNEEKKREHVAGRGGRRPS